MAVIEEEHSGENDLKSQPNSAAAAASSGYTSDGYETASDTELNESVSEPENHCDSNDNGTGNRDNVGDGDVSLEVKEERQEKTDTIDTQAIEVMI